MTEVYDWRTLTSPAPAPVTVLYPARDEAAGYAETALQRECYAVATTAQGGRNARLNKAAFNLGQLVPDGHLAEPEVVASLLEAAQACGLPDTEAVKTTRSGVDAGKKKPRQIKPLAVADDGASLAALVAPAAPGGAPVAAPGAPVQGAGAPGGAQVLAAGAAPVQGADPRERTSWWPVGLPTALLTAAAAPVPTVLWRDDDHCLIYPGKTNGLIGESESGKSWIGLKAIAEELLSGHRVLMLDFEDSAGSIGERLKAMGVDDDALALLDYCTPEEALGLAQVEDLAEALSKAYSLIVVDGVNAAMTLMGFDLNSNTDATLFDAKLLRPLARTGAAVLTIDHVPKNTEARGKGGIGAQAKRAMLTGCTIRVEVVEPFGRGQNGTLRLTVDKDRPGRVRGVSGGGSNAGKAVLKSDADTGRVRITIEAPDLRPAGERGPFRPTGLMEKVSEYLEDHPGSSKNELLAGVGGKKEYVETALQLLLAEGYVAVSEGPRRRMSHSVARPYVQRDDPASDDYQGVADLVPGAVVPTIPTGPRLAPGTSRVSGPRPPTPYRGGPVTGPVGPAENDRVAPDLDGYENCNGCGSLLPSWSVNKGYCSKCSVAS